MTFSGATQDFEDISELTADLVSDTTGEGLFSEFSFVMDDETAALAATASSEEQDVGDLGLDPSALTGDVFSANFILGMPGTVVEHNADEVLSDGRLKWTLPILGGTKTFVAKSEIGGSSLWWLWIVLGVVLVVGVIAIIAAVVLGRRQEKQAVTDAAAQYPQSAADALGTPDVGAAAAGGAAARTVDVSQAPDAAIEDAGEAVETATAGAAEADADDQRDTTVSGKEASSGEEPASDDGDSGSGDQDDAT
jgi:hypothetical protein